MEFAEGMSKVAQAFELVGVGIGEFVAMGKKRWFT